MATRAMHASRVGAVAGALALVAGLLIAGTGVATAATAGAIGNRVWIDADGDAVQDPGELGLAGVRVTVSDLFGRPLVTGLTADGGWWGIRGLTDGVCYRLAFEIPAGYRATTLDPQGPAASAGGSVVGPDGKVPVAVCATAAPQTAWDAGFVPVITPPPTTGSVGGRVVADSNDNAATDATDVGLPNVGVSLRLLDGTPVQNGSTDASGWYRFRNLRTDRCYRMVVTMPSGYRAANSSTFADGSWAGNVCPTVTAPDVSGVSPLLTNVPAGGGDPGFPTYYRHPGGTVVDARVVAINTDLVGGQRRLFVRLQDPIQPLNAIEIELRPRPELTELVPGRYVVTPSARSAKGSVTAVTTGSPECSAGRRMTATIRELSFSRVDPPRLSMTFTDTCGDVEGRVSLNRTRDQVAPDRDGDGTEDTLDNCLDRANPTQADDDSDGLGNECDSAFLITSVGVFSNPGEEVFGGSFVATPANAAIDVTTIPTAAGPLVDGGMFALQDFRVVVNVVHVPAPGFRIQPDAIIELRFKRGDRTTVGATGGMGQPRSNAFGRAYPGPTFVTCPFAQVNGATIAVANLGVASIRFDPTLRRVTAFTGTTTQRCLSNSPPLTTVLRFDEIG